MGTTLAAFRQVVHVRSAEIGSGQVSFSQLFTTCKLYKSNTTLYLYCIPSIYYIYTHTCKNFSHNRRVNKIRYELRWPLDKSILIINNIISKGTTVVPFVSNCSSRNFQCFEKMCRYSLYLKYAHLNRTYKYYNINLCEKKSNHFIHLIKNPVY